MHRTALARTKGRARSSCSGRSLRTRALKNRLAGNWATGGRPSGSGCSSLRSRRSRPRRGRFVHRARAGLGNDHARSGWLRRRGGSRRRSRTRCSRCDLWSCRSTHGRRSGRGWRDGRRRGRSRRARRSRYRSRRQRGWLLRCRRCNYVTGWSCWRDRRRRGGRRSRRHGRLGRRRRRNCRLCRYRRRGRAYRGRSRRFLLLGNCSQHISGAGDMRQINLGFDFLFATQRAGGTRGRCLRFGRAPDMGPHLFRFMLLDGTGMGLLFRHSHER